jgi:hypothetical protein
MARVETETVIFDITALLVPGCAFLGVALHHGDALLYALGGSFVVAWLVAQYFRLRFRR